MTAPMVAAGAVAKKWLFEHYGTVFRGCMTQIGEMPIGFESWEFVPNNPFFAPVADVSALETYMEALRKAGDSCGAKLRVSASNVPVGLGDHAVLDGAGCGAENDDEQHRQDEQDQRHRHDRGQARGLLLGPHHSLVAELGRQDA